jgi:hypothetical protein
MGTLQAQDRPTNPLRPSLPTPARGQATRPASGTSVGRGIRATSVLAGSAAGDTSRRALAAADSAKGPEDQFATTVKYSSKDSSQVNGQVVELWGDAEVVYGDISLKADYIKLNQATNEVFARGRYDSTAKKTVGSPIFKDRSETYNTKEIRYNFKTKKALVTGIITQQGDGNIRGKTVKKDAEDNLYIRGSIYTTCNMATPHFHINSPRLKVVKNRQVVSGPFNLAINQIPLPIGLPFGFFPFPKRKDIGVSGIIMPQYGEEPNGRGFFLRDGGYYWAVNEHIGLQFTGQIYSQGSWGVGMSSAYNKRYRYTGGFQLRFNRNFPNEILAQLKEAQARNDFQISWNHSPQNIGRRGSFSASVNVTSNSFNQFNAFNTAAVVSNGANSQVQYSRTFGKYVRAGANVNVNQQFGQVNQLTAVRENGRTNVAANFTMGVQQIAPFALKGGTGKWYESFRLGLDFNASTQISNTIRSQFDTTGFNFPVTADRSVFGRPTSRTQFIQDSLARAEAIRRGQTVRDPNLIPFNPFRASNLDSLLDNQVVTMRYSIPISLPNIKLARYINLTPGFSLQGDVYNQKLDYRYNARTDTVEITRRRGFFPSYQFSVNASMNTRFYGTVFVRGRRLEAIRHTVAPQVSISYTPDFSNPNFGFYTRLEGPEGSRFNNLPEFRRTVSNFRGLGGTYGSTPPGASGIVSFGLTNQLEAKVRSRDDTAGKEFQKIPILDNLSINGSYNLLANEFNLSNINLSANTQILKKINFNVSATFDPYSMTAITNTTTGTTEFIRQNVYAIRAGQGLARLTSLQAFMGVQFAPKKADKPKTSPNASDATMRAINQNPDLYVDFNIPWSVNINYSFGYTSFNPETSAFIQTLNLTGDFSLTPKWKFTFQTGYDFQLKAPSITTLGINRDLHCWEMAFNWTPFAGSAFRAGNYSFDLRVKSAILQELKLSRRRSFYDTGGFGGGFR